VNPIITRDDRDHRATVSGARFRTRPAMSGVAASGLASVVVARRWSCVIRSGLVARQKGRRGARFGGQRVL